MMNLKLFFPVLLCLLLILTCSAVARGQTTELPSAPVPSPEAKPAPPGLSLPPGTPRVVAESNGAAPSAPVGEDECYAPAEGLYAPHPKASPEVEEALARYMFVISTRLDIFWNQHMPRAANDTWIKGKIVVVRFAIMLDGSIDSPIITLTSGRKDYDKHAMDAVTKAAPFAPLPPGAIRPLPVCMRFGYNTDPRPKEDAKPDPWLPAPKPKP
jgi:TonB family protein